MVEPDGLILALDTSTRTAGVALYDGQSVCVEISWHSADHHTVELMPYIASAFERQHITPERLTGVAVAIGPGSFTGLRIGLSVAKGLALSLGIALVGVPTLDIIAYAHRRQPLPICAVIQAGRGRLAVANYATQRRKWERTGEIRLLAPKQLLALIERRTFFCGEIDSTLDRLLRHNLGERAVIADPAESLRRAGYLAELGWLRLQAGERDDLVTLAPIYLHGPEGRDVTAKP